MAYRFAATMVMASGKKVVSLRKSLFLSRDELAERSKITRSNLQRIEQSDVTNISLKTLRKLAAGIGRPPAELEMLINPNAPTVMLALSRETHAALEILAKERNETIADYLNRHVAVAGHSITRSRGLREQEPTEGSETDDCGNSPNRSINRKVSRSR